MPSIVSTSGTYVDTTKPADTSPVWYLFLTIKADVIGFDYAFITQRKTEPVGYRKCAGTFDTFESAANRAMQLKRGHEDYRLRLKVDIRP